MTAGRQPWPAARSWFGTDFGEAAFPWAATHTGEEHLHRHQLCMNAARSCRRAGSEKQDQPGQQSTKELCQKFCRGSSSVYAGHGAFLVRPFGSCVTSLGDGRCGDACFRLNPQTAAIRGQAASVHLDLAIGGLWPGIRDARSLGSEQDSAAGLSAATDGRPTSLISPQTNDRCQRRRRKRYRPSPLPAPRADLLAPGPSQALVPSGSDAPDHAARCWSATDTFLPSR